MPPMPIAVVGSLNMDLVVRSPRFPRPGETLIGGPFQTAPGGKGANQAVAAARMGGQVRMVGRVGADDFGESLLAGLARDGVDHRHVRHDPDSASGTATIIVDQSGQNCIVVAPGANARLTVEDVDAAEADIASARVLLLQLQSPLIAVTRAATLARSHGVHVLLNPAPAQPLPPELLACVDILTPNESETASLTGLPVATQADLESAARALQRMGPPVIILTLGERGALLALGGDQIDHFPAFAVTPVDTTAAGDAFVGALAVALAEGRPLPEAVHWGNAAGALATARPGAQPSLPTRAEVEALLAR